MCLNNLDLKLLSDYNLIVGGGDNDGSIESKNLKFT
jgi:hypothetical protein